MSGDVTGKLDPPPPWTSQMRADLVPSASPCEQPRGHEEHSFASCGARNPAFAALSAAFASLSLIGDAVRWRSGGLDRAGFGAAAVREAAGKCACFACNDRPDLPVIQNPVNQRMWVCTTCGNKRCPHAAHHDNACTNSNEPGQKGSL